MNLQSSLEQVEMSISELSELGAIAGTVLSLTTASGCGWVPLTSWQVLSLSVLAQCRESSDRSR